MSGHEHVEYVPRGVTKAHLRVPLRPGMVGMRSVAQPSQEEIQAQTEKVSRYIGKSYWEIIKLLLHDLVADFVPPEKTG